MNGEAQIDNGGFFPELFYEIETFKKILSFVNLKYKQINIGKSIVYG